MEEIKKLNKVTIVDIFNNPMYECFSVAFNDINMSEQASDYNISSTGVEGEYLPNSMYLIPETTGEIVVELVGMTEGIEYKISAKQVENFQGRRLPYNVRKVVKQGTTAIFSVVW